MKNLSASSTNGVPIYIYRSCAVVRLRALIRACVDCVSNQLIDSGIFDKSVGYGVVVPTQEHRDAATEDRLWDDEIMKGIHMLDRRYWRWWPEF
ncbi:hypothetical protein QYF36_005231 [Acer negundo]|nr:hypothetical protein QYF36_005231 [Acer negundo]